MKIIDLTLNNLRNEEHFQFHTAFRDLVLIHKNLKSETKVLFSVYLTLYGNEQEALIAIRERQVPEDLILAYNDREHLFRGFIEGVRISSNHFSAGIRTAARRLMALFNAYVDMSQRTFDEETEIIDSIISDLRGYYAKDAEFLRLEEWVEELDFRNENFAEIKNSRYTPETVQLLLNMREARMQADSVYRQIVERVNALIIIDGETSYGGFVNDLNEKIKSCEMIISIRANHGLSGN
jgi:hypothetical protein